MQTIKITPNLLFEYQCTSGKLIRLPNRIETFFARIGMLYNRVSDVEKPTQRHRNACISLSR